MFIIVSNQCSQNSMYFLHIDHVFSFVRIPNIKPNFNLKQLSVLSLSKWGKWLPNFENAAYIYKQIWSLCDQFRTGQIKGMQRPRVWQSMLWLAGVHIRKLDLPFNDYCRIFWNKEDDESIEHLICLFFQVLRMLVSDIFGVLSYILYWS